MSDYEPWYRKNRSILVVILLVGIFLLLPGSRESRASSRHSDPAQSSSPDPTDNSQADQKSAESVNLSRLKELVQASEKAPADTTNLDNQINAIINSNIDILFGVSIKDLTTGTTHDYGNQKPMTAASVTKVLTATDYMKEVEAGHKSLNTIMVDGNTAHYDIEQMIVVSDNNAWHVLNDALTYSQLQAYAESIGLSSYYYGDNVISAGDTTKLLSSLYERSLINESHTQLLLSYMERANYRDLIIPAVPAGDTVYHKAGEYLINLNDAAIITNSTDTIVLSIYSESLYSYDKARVSLIMQQITTPALETFQLN